MTDLLTRALFTVGRRTYTCRHVLQAAAFWGDFAALETGLQRGLACCARAEVEGDPLPEPAVETAGLEFRYARDLLTADAMDEWLDAWDLTPDAWAEALRRRLLLEHWGSGIDETMARDASLAFDAEGAPVLLVHEALMSGRLEHWARALAARVAVCDAGENAEPDADGLAGTRDAAAALARLDSSYQAFRAALLTDKAIREMIGVHQLDWIRIALEELVFVREAEAREAVLCVREDGQTLAGVAAQAGASVQDRILFLDGIPDEVRDRFLGAETGTILGPLVWNDGYGVVRIVAKVLPSGEDPQIRARAENSIVERALDRRMQEHVRWLARF